MTTTPNTNEADADARVVPDETILDYLKSEGATPPAEIEARLKILRREDVVKPTIYIGMGTCGLGAGAAKVLSAIRDHVAKIGLDADIVEVGCIGLCASEPIVDIQLPGRNRVSFMEASEENVAGILDAVLADRIPTDNLIGQFRSTTASAWRETPYVDEHPFFKPQLRWVLASCGVIDPTSIEEYVAGGGYLTFLKTIRGRTPEEVCDIMEESGLRGRGGGGFPTGRKWKFALREISDQKYLICNADEGDPGAFMDRALIESDPHRLLEGMLIAAYAIRANKAYIYIRAEYPLAVERLGIAIEQARAYGLAGDDVMGSGFSLEFVVKMGAGAFVCGEETALIHSIEGKRGMPRPRPPYPAVSGLFGKPTVINNVETLANVPGILRNGAAWFNAVGTAGTKGTKIFALSGKVNRTGLVEVAMGTTIRNVVFDVGGGPPGGRAFKAVQIGGPSGGCLPTQLLDTPVDYETIKNAGAIMGSGGLVVMDETTCMVDLAKYFMEFIQNESCGKCIPCREGTRRMLEILTSLVRSRRHEEENDALLRVQGIMELERLARTIKETSLCGLGQTAPNPVLGTLRWFRDEYEAHLFERRCPAGSCRELVGASCQNTCPVGTEVWSYVARIARGEYEEAYRTIRAANPFPSACARVCHHPCERNCRAGTTGGDPIAIRALKRFVVDRVDPSAFAPAVVPAGPDAARVAVVGAGPSVLTAAHYLALAGHKVTVFEREAECGGMLVQAIPAYRLPREPLRREIAALENPNVEIRRGQALGRDITVDDLFAQGYKAVYLAIGAHKSRNLDLPGEDADGVLHGIAFLKAHNLRGEALAKGRVGIVGGGNSAMDAARVAFRQDGVESVTIFYRRTRAEMPAYAEEIEAGLEEGIRIEELAAPVAVRTANDRLSGVRFIRNTLGEPDASGRRRPVPVPGSEFDVPLDTLIVAIGEEPETAGLDQALLNERGAIAANAVSYATERPGVFAGGDAASGPNTAIAAIAAGKNAAVMIDRYIKGKLLKTLTKVKLPSVYIPPPEMTDVEAEAPSERVRAPMLPVEKRRNCFAEVELSLDEADALREARRCLRCDLEFTEPAAR